MLLRSGIIIAAFTFLSRIFGMVRELFIAATFGTGPVADSVNVAFKLPNLFRRIFGEGALASVFVPLYAEKLSSSTKNAEQFASKVFFLLTLVLIFITLLMQYFMPELMAIIAPGFNSDPTKFEHTVSLCRITIPYLIFICLSALIGSMLNSVNKFAAFAAAPLILNVGVIAGTIFIGEYIGNSDAVAWSISASGLCQLVFMLWCLYKNTPLRIKKPCFEHNDKDIRKLLKMMIPATISGGATQLNLFISQSIASFIPGAVSILSYADRIYQLPMSIIGVTFGTVLLPTLSKLYKAGELKTAGKTQEDGIKFGLFLSAPCSTVLIILAYPVIKLIYERGAFTAEDTILTGDAIAAFALGIPAFVLGKIFLPIFYANQDAKTPMYITIYTIIANIVLNLILMKYLAHVGIALGSTIAAWFNVYLFMRYAKKHGYFRLSKVLMLKIGKILLNSFICAIIMHYIYSFLEYYFRADGIIPLSICVLGSIFLSFILYIISSFYMGIVGKDFLLSVVKRKIVK